MRSVYMSAYLLLPLLPLLSAPITLSHYSVTDN